MADDINEFNANLDKLLRVLSCRRWWLLLTVCGVALGTILVSLLLPKHYRSEATILVEQQQVPQRYVVPNSTADLSEALQAMTQDVLSRPRLLQIISQFDLYPKARERLGPEELVELMRKNIEIEPIATWGSYSDWKEKNAERRDVNAFKISFTGDSPRAAQQIASRLTSLFIEENLKTREQQATGTTDFLQDQLATAQVELQNQEQRLRDFKTQYLGELPEQQGENFQILAGLHMQLQNTVAALSRAQEQHVYLESLLAEYPAPAGSLASGSSGGDTVEAVEKELANLLNERAKLSGDYSPKHPDVRRIDEEIAQSEALLDRLKKDPKTAEARSHQSSLAFSGSYERDTALAQVHSQLEANRVEIANNTADEKRLEGQIAEYQRRLNLTPVREQQLAELLRNYNLSQQNYSDLENKRTQSALATKLEKNRQGQPFRIVNPANLPSKPSSPNRPRLCLIGAILGVFLGVGLSLLVEVRDRSFRSEKEVIQGFTLPMVIGVPTLLTPTEERKRSIKRTLEWATGTLLVLAVFAAELLIYWRG